MDPPTREHRGAVSRLFGVASEPDTNQPSVGFSCVLPGAQRIQVEHDCSTPYGFGIVARIEGFAGYISIGHLLRLNHVFDADFMRLAINRAGNCIDCHISCEAHSGAGNTTIGH